MTRTRKPDPRSGLDEDGAFVPAFEGQREPFRPGQELRLTHGAYAPVRLGARALEITEELRPVVPGYRPSDEVAVRLLAVTLARIEAADAALVEVDAGLGERGLGGYVSEEKGVTVLQLQRLREDQRSWINTARRLMNDLGMTPAARARLGLDVAQARRAITLTELAAEAEYERRAGPSAERDEELVGESDEGDAS